MKRVHIVGLSPRSGTTLMMELMAHCFDFHAYADHEMGIFQVPHVPVDTFCSKSPGELLKFPLVAGNENLWVICMVRDPRDVIVSKHKNKPDLYWTNLNTFQYLYKGFKASTAYENFIPVRYEDLVCDPNMVQKFLSKKIPFLTKKADFTDFHKVASPTIKSISALGGVREISTSSVNNWKKHLPRLKAQIDLHGDITEMLIDLGYEKDNKWLEVLDGVEADFSKSNRSNQKIGFRKEVSNKLKIYREYINYRLGIVRKKKVILK